MPRQREIIDAADVLSGLSDETLDNLLSPKAAAIIKGRSPHAASLDRRERFVDIGMEPHREPSAAELKTGPAVEASGGGTRRMARYYDADLVGSPQIDPTSRLGEMLETLEDMTKAVRLMLEKAKRDRMQDVYPRSAEGRNGGAEVAPEEEEEEEARKAGLGAVPSFRTVTSDNITMLEMSAKELFNVLLSRGPGFAKSAPAMMKAKNCLTELTGEDWGLASNWLLHCEAARSGAYSISKCAGELAHLPGNVIDAMLRHARR